MLERLGDVLSMGFMQRALLGGAVTAAACALLSVFVVLKRMAFVGQGVSHAAFGGVALAVLLGFPPSLGALIFAVATGIGIGVVSRNRQVAEDSTIGIFLSTAMALGLIFLGMKEGSTADLFGYLFGSILTILPSDIPMMLALGGGVFVLLLLFIKELYFYVFDEEMARVSGLPVDALYFGLLVVLAVTVVVSIKLMGAILVTALLILPGATARLWTSNIVRLMFGATALGVLGVVIGLLGSYLLDLSPGATVVLLLFLVFVVSLLATRGRRA